MENTKKNSFVVVILLIIILGLAGFIVYDKVFNKTESNRVDCKETCEEKVIKEEVTVEDVINTIPLSYSGDRIFLD